MKVHFLIVFKSVKNILFLTFLSFVISTQSLMAQERKPDTIIKRNSIKIEATILEVNDKEIKYKKYNDKDGPTFTLGKENISSIIYSNGDVENLNPASEEYYDPSNPGPSSLYQERAAPATRYIPGHPRALSTEQLKFNEKFCYGKSAKYRNMGITGVIAGSLLTVGGILLINDGCRNYYKYGSQGYYLDASDQQKVGGGVLCVFAGLGGGITFTAIGFSKTKSYNKKAQMYGAELRKRDLSFLNLQPQVDVARRTAGVSMSFHF